MAKKAIVFSCDEFIAAIQQASSLQHSSSKDLSSATIFLCPADPEDEVEFTMFHGIRSIFAENPECTHVPQMRLDGESLLVGKRRIRFDRDYQPDPALLEPFRTHFEDAWGLCNAGTQGFQAWTFVLECVE